MKKPILSLIACSFALSSCALETQEIIFPDIPGKPKKVSQEAAPTPAPPPVADGDNDGGFRLPDMYAMPDEEQLKSTTTAPSGDGGDGTVTAQPPSE